MSAQRPLRPGLPFHNAGGSVGHAMTSCVFCTALNILLPTQKSKDLYVCRSIGVCLLYVRLCLLYVRSLVGWLVAEAASEQG